MVNELDKLMSAGFSAEDYDELVNFVNKYPHPFKKSDIGLCEYE